MGWGANPQIPSHANRHMSLISALSKTQYNNEYNLICTYTKGQNNGRAEEKRGGERREKEI